MTGFTGQYTDTAEDGLAEWRMAPMVDLTPNLDCDDSTRTVVHAEGSFHVEHESRRTYMLFDDETVHPAPGVFSVWASSEGWSHCIRHVGSLAEAVAAISATAKAWAAMWDRVEAAPPTPGMAGKASNAGAP